MKGSFGGGWRCFVKAVWGGGEGGLDENPRDCVVCVEGGHRKKKKRFFQGWGLDCGFCGIYGCLWNVVNVVEERMGDVIKWCQREG